MFVGFVLFALLSGVMILEGVASPIAIEAQHRLSNVQSAAPRKPPVRRAAHTTTRLSPSLARQHSKAPKSSTRKHRSPTSTTSPSIGPPLNVGLIPSFNPSQPFAVSYDPYTAGGGCKDVTAIAADLEAIHSAGFQCVRIYGVDCNQVENMLCAMEQSGIQLDLFLGIYNLSDANNQAATLISAVNGSWSKVVTIGVGNEPVNDGQATPATVISTTSYVRGQLRAAGYAGPVVAVDTFIAIFNNPSLCEASDYIAANAHPYFDGSVAATEAGTWVAEQASKLSSLCGGKSVLITETGWPSAGNSNGAAVPSPENQAIAKSSILSAMQNQCVLFSAFDDLWKSPGEFDVEQHWGIL